MTVISMEGEAKSSGEKVFRGAWRVSIAVLVSLLLFLAWLVRTGELYDSNSDFAYNIGLTGGLLMLSLLLYPLRKRIHALERLGKMESWFKFHMVAGITGPLLVLFHSTFRTGSLNGAMALYAMLLVALSGIVGRFIYRHIHRGLYGNQLTLAEAAAELNECADNVRSVYALQPDIEPRLKAFRDVAFDPTGSRLARAWRFITLRWRSRRLARQIRSDAKRALRRQFRKQGGKRREVIVNYRLAREQIDRYLDSVVKASQLSVWERLFSFWHIVHIPFLYLLVFSGVVHVVAVHMY
ncbi:MAG: hypothetical protein CVU33_04700 [Betaproteobacteria bacterium HGW-Betaproteobacteria-6]|jgi:hypothetical protein|nr:MAG: hypothetical protein CVU33_04700 [Betaproteobacteria bacterium HGW-Betaproteobacteria-6]